MWFDIPIDRGDVGVRVDRVLLRHLSHVPGISRTRIQAWIAEGGVLVNDRPPDRPAWRLAAGDRVSVQVPDSQVRTRPQAEDLPLDILYEDEDLLALNKPAGMVVHPSYRNSTGTLLNAVLWHLRPSAEASAHGLPAEASALGLPAEASAQGLPAEASAKAGIIQRLDKQTSGVLLVAKRRSVQAAVQRAMYRNDVAKDYLAVVVGRPSPVRGTIDLALDRDPWDRRRVIVRDRGGQPSVTKYERLAVSASAHATFSLLRCRLVTGRTHQIRVHLSARGWPIVGDPTYGPGTLPRMDDEATRKVVAGFTRQALHAWRVTLQHPTTGAPLDITAPLPDDMARLLAALTLSHRDLPRGSIVL
jgi:23S rRNA pseudouridine1911/1915/1917 synthase